MPVRVTDYISTSASGDTYATHVSTLGRGGHQEVPTINDRNSISVERQNIGMKVSVAADGKMYELNSSLQWVEYQGVKQTYTHDQQGSSNTWEINHNLGFYPNVLIIDSEGDQVVGNIVYNSINTITLNFSISIFGKAYLS